LHTQSRQLFLFLAFFAQLPPSLSPSLSPHHIHLYLYLARSLARSALAPPARSLWGETAVAPSSAVCACFPLSLSLAGARPQLLQVEQALSHVSAICLRMLTNAYVCWRMLTYADICWHMLTYADICWHMLTSGCMPAYQTESSDARTSM
jgi:hypothetical protein